MLRMGRGDCFNRIDVLKALVVCCIPDDIEALGFAYSRIDTIGILTNLRKLYVSRESWITGWKACSGDDGQIDHEGVHALLYFLAVTNKLQAEFHPTILGKFERPDQELKKGIQEILGNVAEVISKISEFGDLLLWKIKVDFSRTEGTEFHEGSGGDFAQSQLKARETSSKVKERAAEETSSKAKEKAAEETSRKANH